MLYVGSYEAFWLLVFFTLLGATEMDSALLLAIGVISHLIRLLPIVILGCISVVWLGVSFGEIFTFKKYVAATQPVTNQNQVRNTNRKEVGKSEKFLVPYCPSPIAVNFIFLLNSSGS
jgi:hypothetical protein